MTALDYASPPAIPTAGRGVIIRLSIMMLLQYAVWGVWLPYLASYLSKPPAEGGLGFDASQMGLIFGVALSLGAVAAPFIAGQVADRYLNAERALALLLLVGGVLNILLARVHGFVPFLLVSIAYSIAYMPTLSLTNSIAFQNLPDTERQFPMVRLWGTIGWVVASTAFTKFYLSGVSDVEATRRIAHALIVSGVLSIGYSAYALLVLPKTPPRVGTEPLAFLKAFRLLGNPAFLLVTLVALPIAMIHQVYFMRGAPYFEAVVGVKKEDLGWVLGIGQASEIVFLLVLGFLLKRVGYKWVLVLGCVAYAARFGIFALGTPPAVVIASQALHGLCYGCFFAGSFLLVEKIASEDIRHSAQTVYGIIILGVGPILAGVYNGSVLGRFETHLVTPYPSSVVVNYTGIWATQAGIALAAAVALVVAFRYRAVSETERGFEVVGPTTPGGHTPSAAVHHADRLS